MFGLFKNEPAKTTIVREFFRACNVYCQPEVDQVVVAAVYNHGGLLAEMPGRATIGKFSDSVKLHDAVRAALGACEYEPDFDYFHRKRSDWPAYQASGYKTIKRFEAEFIRLMVKGGTEKNAWYDVTSPEFGELGLHLTVTVNANGGNYGEAVQYIVKNYVACKTAAETSR